MSNVKEAVLSKTQSGIYIECMNNPESTLYNIPFLGRLGDDIDAERLKGAIEKTIKARPCLNTVICTNDSGEVIQKISEENITVEVFEMTDEEFERLNLYPDI